MITTKSAILKDPHSRRFLKSLGPDFRWELAFPELTEDMVARLRAYGSQETFTGGARLYSHGDCWIDMFVVLEGEVSIFLRSPERDAHVFVRHRKLNFTGEFNLLNSQGAVVEARTSVPSTLLRISRAQLQRLNARRRGHRQCDRRRMYLAPDCHR